MNIVQSSLSIIGAFFVTVVTLGVATGLASWLMLGGVGWAFEATSAFLVVNAVNSAFAALIGGYVVATVAESSPVGHALALGSIMAVIGVAALAYNGWEPVQGQPLWYAFVIMAQAPLMSTLGGIRVMRRVAKGPRRYSKRTSPPSGDARRSD